MGQRSIRVPNTIGFDLIITHKNWNAYDIADRSSMKDTCHTIFGLINSKIDLTQWVSLQLSG